MKSIKSISMLIALGLILTSCERKSYTIEVVDCVSGKTDTLRTSPILVRPYIETYKRAVPAIHIGEREYIYNKCSCRVLN